MALVLEPIYGKIACDGEIVTIAMKPIAAQQLIGAHMSNPPPVYLRLRPWDELDMLDIEMDHPKLKGAVGWYPDTTRPKEPSGGQHVHLAGVIEELRANGTSTLVVEYEYSSTGRRRIAREKTGNRAQKVVTLVVDEVMRFSLPYASWLLTQYGPLLDEVDPDEPDGEVEVIEPTPAPKKTKPAYRKRKAAKEKE